DGLVDPLDGDGRAARGGLEPAGDGDDGSAQALPRLLAGTVGVIDAAAAAAALETVGGVRAAGQGHDAVVVAAVLQNHGVEPLAQRHAGATREVLGDLARTGFDPLYAPRRGCAH